MKPSMKLWTVLPTLLLIGCLVGVFRMHVDERMAFSLVKTEELGRVTSPDSVVDAVLLWRGGGAGTAESQRVYVVPRGRPAPHETGAPEFEGGRVDSLSVRWTAPRVLEVRFAGARIHHFQNYWHSPEIQNWEYLVELKLIQLRPGSSPEAP